MRRHAYWQKTYLKRKLRKENEKKIAYKYFAGLLSSQPYIRNEDKDYIIEDYEETKEEVENRGLITKWIYTNNDDTENVIVCFIIIVYC